MKKQAWIAAVTAGTLVLGGCGSNVSSDKLSDQESSSHKFKVGFHLQAGDSCTNSSSRYKEGELNCSSVKEWKNLCEEVDAVTGIDAAKIAYDNAFSGKISLDGLKHIFENGRKENIEASWNETDGVCNIQYSLNGTYQGSDYNLYSRKGVVLEFFVLENKGKQYVSVYDAL